MKNIILLIAVVIVVGCGKDNQTAKEAPKETPAKTKFSDPANSTEPIKVADSNATKPVKELTVEEKEIRRVLKKPTGELTKADLEKVKGLDFNGNHLTKSPEGLEKLTKLKDLFLSGNQLTNVKGLEKLTQLQDLWLADNKLTSVKSLEMLTQLKHLYLHHNKLSDVKGLEKLLQLKSLHLHNNQLTSVKGLENLTQLKDLFLEDNKLTDVKGLEKLNQLTKLDLRNNPDLTKAQIAELQKALPKCKIHSNPTK